MVGQIPNGLVNSANPLAGLPKDSSPENQLKNAGSLLKMLGYPEENPQEALDHFHKDNKLPAGPLDKKTMDMLAGESSDKFFDTFMPQDGGMQTTALRFVFDHLVPSELKANAALFVTHLENNMDEGMASAVKGLTQNGVKLDPESFGKAPGHFADIAKQLQASGVTQSNPHSTLPAAGGAVAPTPKINQL